MRLVRSSTTSEPTRTSKHDLASQHGDEVARFKRALDAFVARASAGASSSAPPASASHGQPGARTPCGARVRRRGGADRPLAFAGRSEGQDSARQPDQGSGRRSESRSARRGIRQDPDGTLNRRRDSRRLQCARKSSSEERRACQGVGRLSGGGQERADLPARPVQRRRALS